MATTPFSRVLAVFTGDAPDRWVEAHVEMLGRLLTGAAFRELRLDTSAAQVSSMLRLVTDELVATHADLVLIGAIATAHALRALVGRLVDAAPCSVWTLPAAPPTLARTLVPIDFSDRSAEALAIATRLLSVAGGGRCQALHVRAGRKLLAFEDADAAGKARTQEALTSTIARVDAGDVDVDARIVESSSVVNAILRASAEHESDLVVMATRGRSRAAALLLPSETRRVAQASPIPVLALKHDAETLGLAGAWRDPRVRTRGDWRFN